MCSRWNGMSEDEILTCGHCNKKFKHSQANSHECFTMFKDIIYHAGAYYPLDDKNQLVLRKPNSNFICTSKSDWTSSLNFQLGNKNAGASTAASKSRSCQQGKKKESNSFSLNEMLHDSFNDSDAGLKYSQQFLTKTNTADDSTSTSSDEYENIFKGSGEFDADSFFQEARNDNLDTRDFLIGNNNKNYEENEDYMAEAIKNQNELNKMIEEINCGLPNKKVNCNQIWSHEATMELLGEYKKFVKDDNGKKIGIYKKIQENLNKKGIMVTDVQIKRKYQILFNKYREIKRHNNKSGNDPINDWPYYDSFEEMNISNQANIQEVMTISSIIPGGVLQERQLQVKPCDEEEELTMNSTSKCSSEESPLNIDEDEFFEKADTRKSLKRSRDNEENDSCPKVKVRKTKTKQEDLVEIVKESNKNILEALKETTKSSQESLQSTIVSVADRFCQMFENISNSKNKQQ